MCRCIILKENNHKFSKATRVERLTLNQRGDCVAVLDDEIPRARGTESNPKFFIFQLDGVRASEMSALVEQAPNARRVSQVNITVLRAKMASAERVDMDIMQKANLADGKRKMLDSMKVRPT